MGLQACAPHLVPQGSAPPAQPTSLVAFSRRTHALVGVSVVYMRRSRSAWLRAGGGGGGERGKALDGSKPCARTARKTTWRQDMRDTHNSSKETMQVQTQTSSFNITRTPVTVHVCELYCLTSHLIAA